MPDQGRQEAAAAVADAGAGGSLPSSPALWAPPSPAAAGAAVDGTLPPVDSILAFCSVLAPAFEEATVLAPVFEEAKKTVQASTLLQAEQQQLQEQVDALQRQREALQRQMLEKDSLQRVNQERLQQLTQPLSRPVRCTVASFVPTSSQQHSVTHSPAASPSLLDGLPAVSTSAAFLVALMEVDGVDEKSEASAPPVFPSLQIIRHDLCPVHQRVVKDCIFLIEDLDRQAHKRYALLIRPGVRGCIASTFPLRVPLLDRQPQLQLASAASSPPAPSARKRPAPAEPPDQDSDDIEPFDVGETAVMKERHAGDSPAMEMLRSDGSSMIAGDFDD